MHVRRIITGLGLFFVAATLLFGMAAPPALAGRFSDVGDECAYQPQIEALAAAHIVEGFQDGSFGPGQNVNRQQFAKMIVLALALPVSDTSVCPFSDVVNEAGELYPYHYVAAAADNGITTGVDATTFAPTRNITIAQAITMVSRSVTALTQEPPPGVTSVFGTFDTIHTPWADRAQYAGLLDGLEWSAAKDRPTDPITRGEVAALLSNLIALRYASPSLHLLAVTDEHLATWQAGGATAGMTSQHYAARIENRGNALVELDGLASGMAAQGGTLWERDLLEFIPRVLAPGEAAFIGFDNTVMPGVPVAASVHLNLTGLPVGTSSPRLLVSRLEGHVDPAVGYVAAGEVVNDTGKDASLVDVGVALYSADGGLLGFQASYLDDLEAGGSTPFTADQHLISPADAAQVVRLVAVSCSPGVQSDP